MIERFHPSAKAMIVQILIVAIALTVIAMAGQPLLAVLFLPALAVVWGVAILLALMARAVHWFIWIEIGDKSVKVVKGILHVRSIVIPYERITHVRISEPLLDRLLGLGTLEIDTAGGGGVEVYLPHVPKPYLRKTVQMIEEKTSEKGEK